MSCLCEGMVSYAVVLSLLGGSSVAVLLDGGNEKTGTKQGAPYSPGLKAADEL